MLKYIFRRILIFFPTLFVITLLGFIISVNAPGDPVERMVVAAHSGGEIGTQSANLLEQKRIWRTKLGLDLPVFYFSLNNLATPDTLYKIFDKNKRAALERLLSMYGNWESISSWYLSLKKLSAMNDQCIPDSTELHKFSLNEINEALNQSRFESIALLSSYDDVVIRSKMKTLRRLYEKYSFLNRAEQALNEATRQYGKMLHSSSRWAYYIPSIKFYPTNQYHRWVFGDGDMLTGRGSKYTKGIIRGDFGTSYATKLPVADIIKDRIGISLFFTLISVFLAYLISIPIGIKSAVKRGSRFDRVSTVVLFILYSMPTFWVATLLLMTFANPDVLPWFPASGIKPATGYPEGAGLFEKLRITLPYLILPTICYTYSSFAFLSRTMRVSMLEVVNQDYIRTAKAKGLTDRAVVYKHALRNALLPIITVFANVFPMAVGGSVILETIFTIPGMGYESYTAILTQNYPMIIAVLTITGVLTLLGFLVSDILYAAVDPRISFSE